METVYDCDNFDYVNKKYHIKIIKNILRTIPWTNKKQIIIESLINEFSITCPECCRGFIYRNPERWWNFNSHSPMSKTYYETHCSKCCKYYFLGNAILYKD